MRSDRYTKAILTIIALCLLWIAAGGPYVLPAVEAQDRTPQRVVVVGWEQGSVGSWRAIPLPVQIAGWSDRTGLSYSLPPPVQRERAVQLGMGMPTTEDASANAPLR
jgi:hypothetical protein